MHLPLLSSGSTGKPRFASRNHPPFNIEIAQQDNNLLGKAITFSFKQPDSNEKIGKMEVLERPQKGIAEIQLLEINFSFARQGYASEVLREYIQACRKNGFKRITVQDTSMDHVTRQRSSIYSNAGFQPISGGFYALDITG